MYLPIVCISDLKLVRNNNFDAFMYGSSLCSLCNDEKDLFLNELRFLAQVLIGSQ